MRAERVVWERMAGGVGVYTWVCTQMVGNVHKSWGVVFGCVSGGTPKYPPNKTMPVLRVHTCMCVHTCVHSVHTCLHTVVRNCAQLFAFVIAICNYNCISRAYVREYQAPPPLPPPGISLIYRKTRLVNCTSKWCALV